MATKEIMRPAGRNVRDKTIQYVDIDYSKHSSVLVYPSTTQALTANVWKKLVFSTTSTNSLLEWDATNNRFIPKNNGNYSIFASMGLSAVNSSGNSLALYKNGSLFAILSTIYNTNGATVVSGSILAKLFVGDYIEVWARTTKATTVSSAISETRFSSEVVG